MILISLTLQSEKVKQVQIAHESLWPRLGQPIYHERVDVVAPQLHIHFEVRQSLREDREQLDQDPHFSVHLKTEGKLVTKVLYLLHYDWGDFLDFVVAQVKLLDFLDDLAVAFEVFVHVQVLLLKTGEEEVLYEVLIHSFREQFLRVLKDRLLDVVHVGLLFRTQVVFLRLEHLFERLLLLQIAVYLDQSRKSEFLAEERGFSPLFGDFDFRVLTDFRGPNLARHIQISLLQVDRSPPQKPAQKAVFPSVSFRLPLLQDFKELSL